MRTAVDELFYNTTVTRGRETSRAAYAAGVAAAALSAAAVVAAAVCVTARVITRVINATPSMQ